MEDKEKVTFAITIVSIIAITLCSMLAMWGVTHTNTITIAITQSD